MRIVAAFVLAGIILRFLFVTTTILDERGRTWSAAALAIAIALVCLWILAS